MADLLLDLAAEVERATGPDREIDRVMAETVAGRERLFEEHRECEPHWRWIWLDKDGFSIIGTWSTAIPAYTASLDAITALIAGKLPGKPIDLAVRRDGTAQTCIDMEFTDDRDPWIGGEGKSPALALCAAFLRALAASQEGRADD